MPIFMKYDGIDIDGLGDDAFIWTGDSGDASFPTSGWTYSNLKVEMERAVKPTGFVGQGEALVHIESTAGNSTGYHLKFFDDVGAASDHNVELVVKVLDTQHATPDEASGWLLA